MDRASYFIKDKALFGSYPNNESVLELEKNLNVKYFVNLTSSDEKKITPYYTNNIYISYPIPDRHVPTDWKSYATFIIRLSDIIFNLKNDEKIYIHCKGGHGRSGVVVASLLCYVFKLSPEDAISHTSLCHNQRKEMKEKWRLIGSPQTYKQKKFIYCFFSNHCFSKACNYGNSVGFSNFSLHPVNIEGMGRFPTAEAAIQACKNRKTNPTFPVK